MVDANVGRNIKNVKDLTSIIVYNGKGEILIQGIDVADIREIEEKTNHNHILYVLKTDGKLIKFVNLPYSITKSNQEYI